MQTLDIEINTLLPEIQDEKDECLVRLQDTLRARKGIAHVHLHHENKPVTLCVHFDARRISPRNVRKTARKAGANLTNRYRHQRVAFKGMNTADEAPRLRRALERIPGMLHAEVNYAAGLAFVAYDSRILQPEEIAAVMRSAGIAPLHWPSPPHAGRAHGHSHGSAPGFLPHWAQERWALSLVVLGGVFLLAGWSGETFFGMAERTALGFFLLAYLLSGYDIASHALPAMLKGHFDTDVLMLAAAAGAAALGEWAEGAFLLFLFGLGHLGEHYALQRARGAINALGKMMPGTARVERGGRLLERPVESLGIGEVVLVPPGERIPVDGEVVAGESAVDQSPITGESVPLRKIPGDEVFAGTINQEGALRVRVARLAKDNTLARVMRMVAEAQSQQSPTQRFTERFTARFVPAVLVFVLLLISVPPLLGWMPLKESFYRGMLLLVAASPCALALGTPASVLAGIAQAARNGVLIKGGAHLENLGTLRVMAFDKTGTLTRGEFQVTDIIPLEGSSIEEILQLAAAVEQSASHPLAQAIVKAARERQIFLPPAEGLENLPGLGIKSIVNGKAVWIGSRQLFETEGKARLDAEVLQALDNFEAQGKTAILVQEGDALQGMLALADAPRPGSKGILRALRALGIGKLVMLTGDNEGVARRVAAQAGITDVRAALLPAEKLAAIRALQAEHGPVAMVGDGVNDAPALAGATVGIAMGAAGTAAALETADVALMADDLSRLPFAVGLSRASRTVIRQNLAVSLGVMFLLLLTSVFGLVELGAAVVLHEGSSLIVVLNALRLLGYQGQAT